MPVSRLHAVLPRAVEVSVRCTLSASMRVYHATTRPKLSLPNFPFSHVPLNSSFPSFQVAGSLQGADPQRARPRRSWNRAAVVPPLWRTACPSPTPPRFALSPLSGRSFLCDPGPETGLMGFVQSHTPYT